MTVHSVVRRVPIGPSLPRPSAVWLAVATVTGVAVGIGASISPTGVIALALAVALLISLIRRPSTILIVLIASVFMQVITVSGVTIGRLLGPIALFLVVVALLRGQAVIRLSAPFVWVIGYTLWALASGIWSSYFGDSMTQFASLAIALSYMLAFATLLENKRDADRVLQAIAVMALGAGLIGMATSQGRAGAATGDANFFAMIEIVALPLVLAVAADQRVWWRRLGLYGIVLVTIAAVFSSLSRGGLLSLGVVLVGIVVLPSQTFFRSPRQKMVVLLVLAVAVVGAYKLTSQALSARVDAVFTPQGDTGSGRLNVWRAALTSVDERPFTGLGYGAFKPNSNELMLRTSGVDLSNFRLRPNGLYAHSAYIETIAEIGIPGLVLFLGMLCSTAIAMRKAGAAAYRAGAASTKRLADALLVSLAGWATASLFLSSETSRPVWILIGMTLALPKLTADEVGQREDRAKERQR